MIDAELMGQRGRAFLVEMIEIHLTWYDRCSSLIRYYNGVVTLKFAPSFWE
jgi:hypothetical protein